MKNRVLKIGIFGLLLLSLVFVYTPAEATDVDGDSLLQKMKLALEPEISSTRTLIFSIKDHGKTTSTWTAREAREKLPDGKRTLLVMLAPLQVKGVAQLVWEQKDGGSLHWVYLPGLKRTTKMGSVSSYDSFQGTDFTYSDIGFLDVRGSHRIVGEEEFGGVAGYQVETIPEETYYYSKIITWLEKETYLPLKREIYDVAGVLWKVQSFEEATVINNIRTPLLIRMQDVQANTSTEYRVSEVCYGAELPDEIFKLRGLPNALQFDFCPLPAPSSGMK